jgi:hypothetical protein
MPMIPMRALTAFTLEGARVQPGDRIDVGPTTAAVLHYQRKAEWATIPVHPKPARTRRTYKRRDLRAEP